MVDMADYGYRKSAEEKKQENLWHMVRVLITVLVTVAAAGGAYWIWRIFGAERVVETPAPPPIEQSSVSEPAVLMPSNPGLPFQVGAIQVTPEREAYNDGDLTLIIPRIDFEGPVFGMDDPDIVGEDAVNAVLDNGVGLFYCAQMPGTGNANTSIAGHRDIKGSEFYFLDQITEGDLLYLIWQGKRYTYQYSHTIITDPMDWSPAFVQEDSVLTLQTCTPIGIANERMFVVSKLIATEDAGDIPDASESSQE